MNDVRCKTRKRGARSVAGATRGLYFFPVGPLVATVIVSCTRPSFSASFFPSIFAAGPAPRRYFRVPDCTFRIRTPSSRSSLARSRNTRASFKSDGVTARRLDRIDLLTTSGADPPRFGHSADVVLAVIVVVVSYEEAR